MCPSGSDTLLVRTTFFHLVTRRPYLLRPKDMPISSLNTLVRWVSESISCSFLAYRYWCHPYRRGGWLQSHPLTCMRTCSLLAVYSMGWVLCRRAVVKSYHLYLFGYYGIYTLVVCNQPCLWMVHWCCYELPDRWMDHVEFQAFKHPGVRDRVIGLLVVNPWHG